MKQIKKVLCAMICMVMMLTAVAPMPVRAATKQAQTTSKKVFIINKKYGGNAVDIHYEKVLLKGNTKAIKQINKSLKKAYSDFQKNLKLSENELVNTAKIFAADGRTGEKLFDTISSEVSYNDQGIISIKFSSAWCGGGVCNTDEWGMTFSLKTGKELNLDQVCVSKPSKAASVLKKKILNEDKYADVRKVTGKNIKNMNFYLEPGQKAVVCFGPYELGSGGWVRRYTLKSKFK